MPQKRRRNNNKKKKGKGGPKNNRKPTPAAAALSSSATTINADDALKGDIPEEWKEVNHNPPSRNLRAEKNSTIYSRYKRADKRFRDYMMAQCPNTVAGINQSVDAVLVAADWMKETQHTVPQYIMRDLKLSIQSRHRVAISVYGGGDPGHAHFLEVLQYCHSVLKGLPLDNKGAVNTGTKIVEDKEASNNENRFAAFMEQDDSSDEEAEFEIDNDAFPTERKRPIPMPESQSMSLEELLKSDDRTDAILFLLTLDEMMGNISRQFKMVVRNYHKFTSLGAAGSTVIEILLEAAVATNMAIQQVQQLEFELMLQHPHFTTPYRLLATLALPNVTQKVAGIVQKHAGSATKCKEKDISSYLGDCLECYFRNPSSDKCNQRGTIVQDFCQTWQLDSTGKAEMEGIFMGLAYTVNFELPIGPQKTSNAELQQCYQSMGGTAPHSWLQNMPFIGGDRSIHHTLRLLQAFGSVMYNCPQDQQITPVRGCFGKSPWQPGQSCRTWDLDELLMSDILPQWTTMCRHGILSKAIKLPRLDELCPLFVSMQSYMNHPEKAVTWSTTFAIHSLLTAVLETDSISDILNDVCREVFDNFFTQVEESMKMMAIEPSSLQGDVWCRNMYTVLFLKNLGLPVYGQRAIWNPLCAGTIFSYLTYYGNVEAGCTLIDCHAQLRIVLYLYHGLLINGLLREGQIEVLDILYASFKNSKAIWEGSLPQKGELVQRFWICFGSSIAEAKQLAEQARQGIIQSNGLPKKSPVKSARGRKMSPLDPGHVSKSYRRICNRDFHDVEDKYHTPEQRQKQKGKARYLSAIRTNDTLDAIEQEHILLSINLPAFGAILEQFVCSLGRVLQWEPILTNGAYLRMASGAGGGVENDVRQGFAFLFAQNVLGAFDFAEDPFSYKFEKVPLGKASVHFTSRFFNILNPGGVHWFQATEEEHD